MTSKFKHHLKFIFVKMGVFSSMAKFDEEARKALEEHTWEDENTIAAKRKSFKEGKTVVIHRVYEEDKVFGNGSLPSENVY
jgi:hypothetical protein